MTKEMTEKRKHALEVLKHPKNRTFLKDVLRILSDGGVYIFPDFDESFTKDEIRNALHDTEN